VRASEGNGGWVEVEDPQSGLPGRVYLRLAEVDGVDRVVELYIDGQGQPIRPGPLRRLPLAWLEEWLASWTSRGRRAVAGPDLARLASYFGTSWSLPRPDNYCKSCAAPVRWTSGKAITNWVELSWLAQNAAVHGLHLEQVPLGPRGRIEEQELPELVLEMNDGRLTDAFLSDVAKAYDAAVARRLPPALAIADLVGVEQKTVQSWFAKARKRGLMAPAKSRGRIV
jgi:hypothetical protein